MKKAILLLSVMFSLSVSARFGAAYGTLYVKADTEDGVVQKAQKIIPQILTASVKEVVRFGRQNRCSFRRDRDNKGRIKVTGVQVAKMYKLSGEIMTPYYRAGIRYRFRNCREND